MTAIYAAATTVFAIAALFFLVTQILISWRQIAYNLHVKSAIKKDVAEIKKMMTYIYNKINENTDGSQR